MKKETLGKVLTIITLSAALGLFCYFYYFRNLINVPSNTYQQSSGVTWEGKKESPFSSTDGSGTVWGDKLYVYGGFGDLAITLNQVAEYDHRADQWKKFEALPEPRNHSMMIGLGEQLLIIGGYEGGSRGKREVFSYSRNSTWEQKASLPVGIGAATVQEYGGRIYLFGGVAEDGKLNRDVLSYDHVFDKWSKVSELPTLREHLSSAVLNGEIYIIGGRTSGFESNLNLVEIYNPLKNSWRLGPQLQVKRGGHASVVFGDAIYVFGGERNEGTIEEVEKLTLEKNTWETVSKMPNPRHGLTALPAENGIHVITGGRRPGLSISNINDLFKIKKTSD
jgi:N-acetylneuraminic acid mutarotase